jgi:uncharacterized protein with NAD-binding domain and iron-sulfur cluster
LELIQGIPCWAGVEPAPEVSRAGCARRRLQAGEDFDVVVLAIPAPCHQGMAPELIARSEAYRIMLEHTHSVATVAAQIWLQEPLHTLGWSERSSIYTSGSRPLGSWAEMAEVLDHEQWPQEHRPASVVYFCDACPDHLAALEQDPGARVALLERLSWDWAGVLGGGRMRASPRLLGEVGDQYLRVNHRPSERYVLSLPGTTRHRLAPDESGIQRLYFAGDWTRTSINGGSVEAAVESGQTAAEQLLKRWG